MALFKFLAYLVFGYFIILTLVYLLQRHLIYFPSRHASSPETSGVPEMQEISLHTADGLILKAWYRAPLESHLPTVVHFHGNAGNISNRAIIVRPFLNAGFGVLLLTYRGYSGNPGHPSEEGLYQDARSALEYLQQQGIPSQCIVLYGDSIGAAVAVQMATEFSVGALVLQAPFTTLAAIGQYHYPFFPIKWFLKDNYDTLSKAEKIRVPVLIIHGKNDNIIPAVFGRQLFEALPEPKKIDFIPHVGHNDLYEPGRIIRFINELVKC